MCAVQGNVQRNFLQSASPYALLFMCRRVEFTSGYLTSHQSELVPGSPYLFKLLSITLEPPLNLFLNYFTSRSHRRIPSSLIYKTYISCFWDLLIGFGCCKIHRTSPWSLCAWNQFSATDFCTMYKWLWKYFSKQKATAAAMVLCSTSQGVAASSFYLRFFETFIADTSVCANFNSLFSKHNCRESEPVLRVHYRFCRWGFAVSVPHLNYTWF